MADFKGNILWYQVYEPFGKTYLPINNQQSKHGFAGKEVDNTQLSYFGARYYNSTTSRFTPPDPVAVQPEMPNTFNRYVYANNNPYKYVDPDGRTAKEWFSDVWTGMGVGSTFGLFGNEDHTYSSAYFIGIGLGVGSMFTGEGEALAASKVGLKAKSAISSSKQLQTYWPVNNGALGKVTTTKLKPGTLIDMAMKVVLLYLQ